ncbi:unnamed protein product, partial [Staurois parvus]
MSCQSAPCHPPVPTSATHLCPPVPPISAHQFQLSVP